MLFMLPLWIRVNLHVIYATIMNSCLVTCYCILYFILLFYYYCSLWVVFVLTLSGFTYFCVLYPRTSFFQCQYLFSSLLKAYNHLLAKFLSIYQLNIYTPYISIYTPYISLSKFEPLSSRSGDISLLVFKISKEAVNSHVWTKKYNVYSQNTHTSCVYFDIKFSGLSPIYQNVTLRS